jgi:hypothetical protein
MSNVGLPGPHVDPHFDECGLCQCPCDECITRMAKLCVCLACPCEDNGDHATPPEPAYSLPPVQTSPDHPWGAVPGAFGQL